MKNRFLLFFTLILGWGLPLQALKAQSYHPYQADQKDVIARAYLKPKRIIWSTDTASITNPKVLLEQGNSQAFFENRNVCRIVNKGNERNGLVLDFGKEIHGGIQITTSQSNRVTRKVRIRFGESVSETMSDVIGDGTTGKEGGATNHHAMRDFVVELPGYGTLEVGKSGFRFARIDLIDTDTFVALKEVRAVAYYRDIPYLGSFKSNDTRLNKIWETGAYTVHVNMQDYLWDGIKRDRMVWAGDMHPELMTISSVFGYNEVVPKSLDFVRDNTPLPKWMNGISAYSMWWVIMHHDWYMQHGKLDYLKEQKSYLIPLLDLFTTKVDEAGREKLDGPGMRFLDWPSSENKQGVHAGLQALMVLTFEKGARLARTLGEEKKAQAYTKLAERMRKYVPDANGSKQAASLMSMAGILEARKANNEVIAVGGVKNFSTFYGYYMLQAQAQAEAYQAALENIRKYWGGMLDLGATTFWEDFDLQEAANAAPIDQLVPEGKLDYHRNTGAYCYIGLRRSLCHGWAAGPTPWLTEHVLGIKIMEPGCKTVKIQPNLGDLEWVEGTYPTPSGLISVRHTRLKDGSIKSEIKAPQGIKVIKN
ncbi:alpha-L-rhamnosidase C-terminal domain-containing protein [Pedobacter sp. SYSU D00535]|uniref:alpha-L-rhamnosidase-related protein n=1 Tax=Pedobacter sp. SYSU D00535 TaxID=2810308 RepID=UPI001A97A98E|nr:alpha-L-rhamnosidase C-terminal domain-containing protein [Pedobacter sp. SYSU D00535]